MKKGFSGLKAHPVIQKCIKTQLIEWIHFGVDVHNSRRMEWIMLLCNVITNVLFPRTKINVWRSCRKKICTVFERRCNHALFTLRNVVHHYLADNSTVNICALDISKAFDRVDHFALLQGLMDRNVPRTFIDVY